MSHEQSFSSNLNELDSSLSTSHTYTYPEPFLQQSSHQQSLVDLSISTISTKASKIKDSLWTYFGIERILERQDPRYQQLLLYSSSIADQVAKYQKNQRNQQQHRIQATREVEQCYRVVPKKFFQEGFQLTLARKKAQESLLEQSEYLDQIDLTLFSLVNANFNKYMAPMMEIEEMDRTTQNLIHKISKGRDGLMGIQNQFVFRAIKSQKMSYTSHNKTKLLTAMKYIKKIQGLSQKINNCIKEERCDYQIFGQLEQTREEQRMCRDLKCLEGAEGRLQRLKQELSMYLVGLVDSSLYKYTNKLLVYERERWEDSGLKMPSGDSDDDDNEGNNDITILNITQTSFKQPISIPEDLSLKSQLIKMVKLCSKLQISIGKFGYKLQQRLQDFAQRFQQDLTHYLLQTLKINQSLDLSKCFQLIEIKYYIKLTLSYFTILRNFFEKLVELYNYGNQSIQFSNILSPFKFFIIQQIKLFMGYRKLPPNVDASEFSSYVSLLDYWISAQQQLPQLQLNILQDTKTQLLSLYLKNFTQQTIYGELRSTIRKDTFQPCQIPTEYYIQFENMFNPNVADESLMLENTFSRAARKERGKKKGGEKGKVNENSVRLLNKELSINGERYKISRSFLLLLEILEQYGEMASCLRNCQSLLQSHTLTAITFFSQQTRRMLLNRQLVTLKTIPQVSLRHLCLLARVLCLLHLILSKLTLSPTLLPSKLQLQSLLSVHISDLCKQISTVAVCNIDQEVRSMYESAGSVKSVLGKKAPCRQSINVVGVIVKVRNVLMEYWEVGRARGILRGGLRSVEGLYFKVLRGEGERGKEEIRWVMREMEVGLGKEWEEELKEMGK